MYRPNTIFTPGTFPEYTYIQRVEDERRLSEAIETAGLVTSIAGPTKTGKTVLVHQVVGRQRGCGVPEVPSNLHPMYGGSRGAGGTRQL